MKETSHLVTSFSFLAYLLLYPFDLPTQEAIKAFVMIYELSFKATSCSNNSHMHGPRNQSITYMYQQQRNM